MDKIAAYKLQENGLDTVDANLHLASLLTYSEMLEVASEINYISDSELNTLRQWREDPAAWTPEAY